jgi:hypothetical protein
MGIGTFACTLLSLYTTRQRAAEIEGDLIEESEYHGGSWFIIHVIGVTFALFRESFMQAPLRITLLGLAATGLSVLTCGVSTWLFFAPDAYVPAPLLGLFAIFAWAFLIGFGLEYLTPGLGVRAATLTIIFLTLLGLATITLSGPVPFMDNPEGGIGVILLNIVVFIVSVVGAYAFSIVIFLAPLMSGSVYGQNRYIHKH